MTELSSQIRYLLDTTVLEDYFFSVNPNSKNWLRNTVKSGDGEIVLTPVILLEFVRRLYYVRQKDAKKVRYSIKLLTHAIKQLVFTNVGKNEVKEIARKIDDLPLTPECHVGELSLLPYVTQPNTIVVSSDKGVLESYVKAIRIDPRTDPPQTFDVNEKLST